MGPQVGGKTPAALPVLLLQQGFHRLLQNRSCLLVHGFYLFEVKSWLEVVSMVAHGSKQRAEAPGQGIAKTMRQRSLVPCFKLHLNGLSQILLERLRHRSSGRIVEDQNIALGVEIEGTEIKVRRADDRDVVIHHKRLGVENR